jgi:UDP-3-O-[3-hydroxymyristoyl] N-acetylglucosamine deacetylase
MRREVAVGFGVGHAGLDLNGFQKTLRTSATLSGIGVHSGKPVTMRFNPADADTGIVFVPVGAEAVSRSIPALVSEIGSTSLSTVLGRGPRVATVEHVMAALYGLGIDNAMVEIDAEEAPVMDGSAEPFVDALDQAGVETLDVKRRYIRVLKPVRVESGSSWAEFRPYRGTRFEVEIDFESGAVGRQALAIDLDSDSFRRDVARARTFGFMRDVEKLWASGYALGSSLENSVVIGDDDRVINLEGLRYEDEFVRHKMLDAIGDLALAGARFLGCFRSFKGGHRLNALALRQLLSDRSAFEIVETGRRERGRGAEMIAVNAPVYAPWMI